MAGFKKLIFIQLISWLLFASIGGYFVASAFDNAASNAQHKAQLVVSNYINKHSIADIAPEKLQQVLADGNTFSSFILRDQQGKEVINIQSPTPLPTIAQLVATSFNSIRPQFAVNQASDIKVEFMINANNLGLLLQQGLFVVILVSGLMAIIPIIFMKTMFKKLNRNISMTVAEVIDVYILETAINSSKIKQLGVDLIPSFNRLSHFLQSKHDDIQNAAHSIKQEAYKDVVTELGNRNMFVEYYEKHIESSEKSTFGSLAMVRCSELQAINQTRGYQKGDEYVKAVADIIKHISGTYTDSKVFRLNSSDFAVVLPNTPLKESERFGDNLQSRFTQYQQTQELSSVANTGIVGYEKGKPLGELLSVVDNAMSMAQSKQANAWHVQRETDLVNNVSAGFGNQNWRKVINEVIESERVHLVMQNIMPIGKSIKAYAEIQVRFKTAENQVLPTASFLAMAEKLDILVFEVSEFGLQQNIKASKRFIDMIHRVGARITVERFGVGLTSFKFFRDLKPDFIKMDASYTRGLEEDKNNQYFMRLMVDLAHRIGVSVFAEGVESQEEKHIIETLCLDGVQGYYIEKPKDI